MIPVEVLDHVPVSKNSDIHIEILKGATDPTVKDFEDKAGVWLWKLEPASQQTLTIHEAYHPVSGGAATAGNDRLWRAMMLTMGQRHCR